MASNFLPALRDAVADRICPLANSIEYINDSYRRVTGVPFVQNPLATLGGAVSRLFCDEPPPEIPEPPFFGGQCPGVGYQVTVGIFQNGQLVSQTTVSGIGPVLGLRLEEIDNSSPANPDGLIVQSYVRFGGSPEQSSGAGSEDTPIRILNIVRPDGSGDSCGNPDPIIQPTPQSITNYNFPLTYNDNSGNTVIIPIALAFGFLQINARGEVSIPFKVDVNGEFGLNGTVNANGEINVGVALPGSNIDTDIRIENCRDIVRPDGEVPEDPTDSEQPQQPDRSQEKVIKGALVTVTTLSNERASLIVQDDNPDIYAPSLGHVQFLCRVGQTSAAWTSDQPIKNRRNLIPCPWSDGAIDVRGTPQPGVEWEITPIYGYAEQPVEYNV